MLFLTIIKDDLDLQICTSKAAKVAFMAVTKSTRRTLPFSRPTILRPMRTVRLARYDALNRWIGAADAKPFPHLLLDTPPDGEAVCQLFVAVVEVYFVSLR